MAASDSTGQRILLVDDDAGLRRLISMRLQASGYQVQEAEDAATALGLIAADRPDVVVSDLRMEGMNGMQLFRHLREEWPMLPVIIVTAFGTIPDAIEATREGVFGFLTKPFNKSDLLTLISEAVAAGSAENNGSEVPWQQHIICRSSVMQKVLDEVPLVAESDVSVVIGGESGTGKELLARAIHDASARADKPFVPINCAAVPAELLESELFGHEKGAFTGADRARKGLFREADGGTLFLDEIGDMPLGFQAKLLRALQEQRVRSVGGSDEVAVDVRVVSATHCDLHSAMAKGEFREDLFYRLNVVGLELPALRDRPEDIALLAEHFLQQCERESPAQKHLGSFSPDARRALLECGWPGNVRQLRNVVQQVYVLCRKGPIPADLVHRALREQTCQSVLPLAQARDHFEREYLARTLRLAEGNVSQAARLAGRNRTEFYRLLHRHALVPDHFKVG